MPDHPHKLSSQRGGRSAARSGTDHWAAKTPPTGGTETPDRTAIRGPGHESIFDDLGGL